MANQGEIVVCFGYSQSGKTTWFNTATNSNLPVGDGAGGSVTSVPTLAFSPVYNRPVVDVPGLDDTRLTVTNEETALQVASVVAETHIETGSERLSVKAGGQVPTKTDDTGRESPISTSYEAMTSLDDSDGILTPGMRGTARIKVGSRTVGQWLLRLLWQTFNFKM